LNAPAPGSSRRSFLTRLFNGPDTAATTELTPLAALRQQTDGVLWAAVADAADNMFLAGDDGTVFRFDGDSWSQEDFPGKPPVHSLCLHNDRVYSVGWLGFICERSDGRWRRIQGGLNAIGTDNLPLFEIEADTAGNLWAVGDEGRIVQYNGETWHEHNSGTSANLRSVLPLADGRVLVAGAGGTVLIFDQDTWSPIETDTGCPVVSMAQLSDHTVIAVGGEYDLNDGEFRGRIFLFNDGLWQAVDTEQPLPRLRRVRKCGDNLLICGDDGTAFRWTAEGARRLPTRLRYDLHDIICLDSGEVLICGDGGTLLQETAARPGATTQDNQEQQHWRVISDAETNRTLRAIWPIGKNSLIAVGDSGTVLHIEGEQLICRQTPQKLRIHSLWGSSPKNVFAVCDSSTILHFDGNEWSVAHQGNVDTALLAITGFGPHDIFAVGDSGYALRYDGLMWRQIETGVQQELYGLWGQDSQHLLAVGGGGLVLRWNGKRWKPFSAGTEQDLYGVCGSGLEKLYITGLAGTLIRFEDNAWHRDFSGVRSDLHAVAGSEGVYYAVGSNGTILHNDDGIWESESADCNVTLQAITATDHGIYVVGSGGTVLKRK
jgi:photosystem II stability/assembly factor-like uncharacterized protein